jgi:hypothetical protein
VEILGTATWRGQQNDQFSEKHCILGRKFLFLGRFTDIRGHAGLLLRNRKKLVSVKLLAGSFLLGRSSTLKMEAICSSESSANFMELCTLPEQLSIICNKTQRNDQYKRTSLAEIVSEFLHNYSNISFRFCTKHPVACHIKMSMHNTVRQ